MIFSIQPNKEGCDCIGCGSSPFEGMSTIVRRNDGEYEMVTVCAGCLFKAAVGEATWNKALGKKAPPTKIPEPAEIKPRWFG